MKHYAPSNDSGSTNNTQIILDHLEKIFNFTELVSPMNDTLNSTELIRSLDSKIKNLGAYITYTNQNLDDLFFVICGILILLMQVGFACLEAGSIRAKNVTNIMLKNFLDSLICCVVFWFIGWPLAFGNGNWFTGYTMFAGVGLTDDKLSLWFFQFTFASTASTILSGAVAERSSFVTYLICCTLMSGVIYPIVVHWCWTPEGWLSKLGFVDFSGGMIIHGLSGTVCMVATIIMGPRTGRFQKPKQDMSGHSTALVGIGAIIILVGFCAFNAGTINHYSHPGDGVTCARIARNTILAGAGGALTVMIIGKLGAFNGRRWPFAFTINGGICGLVSSCASCDQFSSVESIITGVIAGLIYTILHHVLLLAKIDDPLDSSPVHFGGGFWSIIALPLLKNGAIISQPISIVSKALLTQLIGGAAIMLWVTVTMSILFGFLHLLSLFRSTEEEEFEGMDISKHGEPAYSNQVFTIPVSPQVEINNYQNTGLKPRVTTLCTTAF